MSMLTFNLDDGYIEALVRGFRGDILTDTEYSHLTECDTLEDMKSQLASTPYGESFRTLKEGKLTTTVITDLCTDKVVQEFKELHLNAMQPCATFFDFITYGYMIDNIILIITGTLKGEKGKDIKTLQEKCHQLGMFDIMPALSKENCEKVDDLFNVLQDTPVGPFFEQCLTLKDLNDTNIEIIRNTLFKAYLEAFYMFCKKLGGATAEVMSQILEFEADRRAINITINSLDTGMPKEDRNKLYPCFGSLYPDATSKLANATDIAMIGEALSPFAKYEEVQKRLGPDSADGEGKSVEDVMFELEVELHKDSFMQQFHYGMFYSYLKLKEQEIRNIVWIAECISQDQKSRIDDFVKIYEHK